MSQLKPMIIVFLMLTSALAGCTGTDGVEGIPGPEGEAGEQGPPGVQGETGSAGADGANGNDGMDGQDGMDGLDVNESRIAELEAELVNKDATITILQGNISDMENNLVAVDNVIEMYYMMFVQINNDINDLQSDINCQIRPHTYCAGSFLFAANLSGVNLFNANLSYSLLRYANLQNANLSNADLNEAILREADMTGADLSNADLTGIYWYDTICPDGTNSDDNGDTCVNNL